jgi:hypothetical protein
MTTELIPRRARFAATIVPEKPPPTIATGVRRSPGIGWIAARLLDMFVHAGNGAAGRFAEEARSIHLGEAEIRAVHGSATPAEAKSLIEEGVPVAPLPLPVVPPNQVN